MDRIHKENIDQWFFASSEGDLNAQEVVEFNNYLKTDPALMVAQEHWSQANLKGIEIEEFPGLSAIQKGRGPWGKKAWFYLFSILIACLIVVFCFFQCSNKKVPSHASRAAGAAGIVKKDPVISEVKEQKRAVTNPPVATPFFNINNAKKERKVREEIPLEPEDSVTVISEAPVLAFYRLEPKEIVPFALSVGVLRIPLKETSNSVLAKKRARQFKKQRRKSARKTFEQNSLREHDPLIIPIESIGF